MFEFSKSFRFLSGLKAGFIIVSSLFLINVAGFSQAPKKIKTIIIDPGHGGQDNGAVGEYEGTLGSKEKNIVLAIAMKVVADLKEQMPGVNIIPRRTTDVYNPVGDIAKFANDNHGDLFVSIHADAVKLKIGSRIIGHHTERYHTTRYIGKGKHKKKIITWHTHVVPTREYFKIPTSRKGTSTLIMAARKTGDKIKALENSDMEFELDDTDSTSDINYDSPEWKANALLYSQKYFKKSFQLANIVQEEIAKTGRNDLGVWQRQVGIRVLESTKMPAILIETGFVENYEDERYLNSEKGQQEIADAITQALIRYKNMVETPKTVSPSPAVDEAK